MAIGDYSTTPGSNTSISGINIGENCPPANINNAIRQLMADLAVFNDDLDLGAGNQPLDATLTALAALTTAANKLIYATGSDAFATTDFTSSARSLLALSSAASMLSFLGGSAITLSGSATSGYISATLVSGGPFKFQWKDATFAGNGSTSVSYPTAFSSWSRAWCTGGNSAAGASDNNPFVASTGTTSCSVYSSRTESNSGTVFAIGV